MLVVFPKSLGSPMIRKIPGKWTIVSVEIGTRLLTKRVIATIPTGMMIAIFTEPSV